MSVSADYKLLFDANPEPMWVFHRKTFRYLAVNDAAIRIYGYSRREWLRMRLFDIRTPDEARRLRLRYRRPPPSGPGGIWHHVTKDGSTIDVDVWVERVEFDGQPAYLQLGRVVTDKLRAEAALERSREMLDSVMRNAPGIISMVDRQGRLTYINRVVPGFDARKVVGTSTYDYIDPAYHELVRATLKKVLATGRVHSYELRGKGPHGEPRWYASSVAPLREGRSITGAVVISSDITHWKKAQEELSWAEKRLTGLFKASRDAIGFIDRDGRYVEVNAAMSRLTGYARQELLRMTYDDLSPPEFRRASGAKRRVLDNGQPFEFEKEYLRKDGARVPVSVTVFQLPGEGPNPARFAAIVRDISERKKLEKFILEGGAQEQSRLGRELHDSLGQEMTGISLMAHTLAGRLAKARRPETEEALRIAEASRNAVEQVRSLAAGLIPSELVPDGLPAALRALAARAEKLFGLSCVVQCPPALPRLEDHALVQLYRIAQESLTNAAKHGGARRAWIELSVSKRQLELRVTDDGRGLDAAVPTGGMGLQIMRHRARMLGGTFELRRGKLGGAVVSCSCPVPR